MSNFIVLNPSAPGSPTSAPGIWSGSTNDSAATIEEAGYLDDRYLNGNGEMNPGDILYINTAIDTTPVTIAGVATLSGTHLNFVAGLPSGGGSGDVSSVFGRTGAVTAESGDYTVSEVTGAAPLASPTFTGTVTVPSLQVNNTLIVVDGVCTAQSGFIMGGFFYVATPVQGLVTLNGNTPVTVSSSIVTNNTTILLTRQAIGGTMGEYSVHTITPGVSFSVVGTAGDTSTLTYVIMN